MHFHVTATTKQAIVALTVALALFMGMALIAPSAHATTDTDQLALIETKLDLIRGVVAIMAHVYRTPSVQPLTQAVTGTTTPTVAVTATEVRANAEESGSGDGYILDAVIEFAVTARGADIYIPKTAVRRNSRSVGLAFRMHDAGIPANAVTDGKTTFAFSALDADQEGAYYVVRDGETEQFEINVWYEPDTPVAVGLTLLSLNWNTAPKAPNKSTSLQPRADFMTDAVIVPPLDPVGTYIGYLGGKQFIKTKNITKADALENCKQNAASNRGQSIRCTWNGTEIYKTEVSATYGISDVKSVTKRGVDPIKDAIDDEYTEYTIMLKNGTAHKVKQFGNAPADMFESAVRATGYTGDINKLVAMTSSATATGTYVGYMDGKKFIETKDITEAEALKNCKQNAAANPTLAFRCTWGSKEIFKKDTPPVSALTGATGKILFVKKQGTENWVWVMNADGTSARKLANCLEGECYAMWSPDGKKIAFERHEDGAAIYVMNADGSALKRLSPTPGSDVRPSWSMDGKKILFTHVVEQDPNGGIPSTEIASMDLNGKNRKTVLSENGTFNVEAHYSPDGSKIVFMSALSGSQQIHVMNADGTNIKQLTKKGISGDPMWSPDGSRISFGSNREGNGKLNIFTMKADGSDQKQITTFIPPYESGDTSWSPDGKKIVFEWDVDGKGQSDPNARAEVWIVNADGTGATTTGQACAAVGCAPRWQPAKK